MMPHRLPPTGQTTDRCLSRQMSVRTDARGGTGLSALKRRAMQRNTSSSAMCSYKAVEPESVTPTGSTSTSQEIRGTEQHAEC